MKETTPSDRVQLIDRGSLMHPGCCALCGSGNCDDGYIDTGVWYDYEGQVYFCVTCGLQIASVIGCLSADETAHLQELLSNAAAELSSVKAELANANERLNGYDTLLLGALATSPDGVIFPSGDVTEDEPSSTPPNPDSSSLPVGQADHGEPVASQPVKSSGRRKPARTQRSDGSTGDGFTI